jgi:alkylation response protein AidB-like acyl-CoA dehydrogenase
VTTAATTTATTTATDYNALPNESFRALLRDFFEREYPAELRFPTTRLHVHQIGGWTARLSQRGWIAPAWPVEWGGMGLTPEKMIIFFEEQERWGVGRAPDQGVVLVGPLLLQHGTEAQKRFYLPKIISNEHIWCQGYSEPNAGSDLASLRCEAVLAHDVDGDHFVVNGQKTWTTLAQDATHIFLLVRTDKAAKKQQGISFLLVDFKTPGITVRPIRNIGGHEEFCEVFFENVRVPQSCLVGPLHGGWTIAKALLGFERVHLGSPKQAQYTLARVAEAASALHLFDDDPASSTATPSCGWTWPTSARCTRATSRRSSAASRWGRTSRC